MTNLISLGMIAGRFQRSVDAILATAKRLEIEPTAKLDGVPFFSESDVERLIFDTPAPMGPSKVVGMDAGNDGPNAVTLLDAKSNS